jgi:hypothetical protein
MTVHDALHVIVGDSAAASLQEAYGLNRNAIMVMRDPVHLGPAPMTHDLGMWNKTRRDFLENDVGDDFAAYCFSEDAERTLSLNLSRLSHAETVTVWVGAGVSEQLVLAWLVYVLPAHGESHEKLRVVTFEKPRTIMRVLFAGELPPDAIRARASPPTPLSDADIDNLKAAWRSFTAPDPAALQAFLDSGAGVIRDGLAAVMRRYPERQSGLGFWDRLILECARDHGPNLADVIGRTMGESSRVDWLDSKFDFIWLNRALKMSASHATFPLLRIEGGPAVMRECSVTVTAIGHDVLAGQRNAVALNGIDEWIGGMHLTPDTVVFRDGDRLV